MSPADNQPSPLQSLLKIELPTDLPASAYVRASSRSEYIGRIGRLVFSFTVIDFDRVLLRYTNVAISSKDFFVIVGTTASSEG